MAETDIKPIDLDEPKALIAVSLHDRSPDQGTIRVGGPARWLRLAGGLTREESEAILAAVADFEKVED